MTEGVIYHYADYYIFLWLITKEATLASGSAGTRNTREAVIRNMTFTPDIIMGVYLALTPIYETQFSLFQ